MVHELNNVRNGKEKHLINSQCFQRENGITKAYVVLLNDNVEVNKIQIFDALFTKTAQ